MAKAEVTVKLSPADFGLVVSALEEAEQAAQKLRGSAATGGALEAGERRAARERETLLQQLRQQLIEGGSR